MTSRRHRGITHGGFAVTLVASALLATGCTPMADAARDAVPRVERIVGDSGAVSASTTESRVNVAPTCSIRVRLGGDAAAAEISHVLEAVWAAPGDAACVVSAVELTSRSSVVGYPAAAMPADVAAATADALLRVESITINVTDPESATVTATSHAGGFATAADLVRQAASSAALDEAWGRVFWSLGWSREDAPYDSVTIVSDAAPSAGLVDVLTGLDDLRASGTLGQPGTAGQTDVDAPIIGISIGSVTESGATTLTVGFTVEGWDAAELDERGDTLVTASRAADAARSIAEIAERSGVSVDSITVNDSVDLLPSR
ncbi:hypothetical protein AB0N73_09580 [Microbacterium sp. NPDC089189]|uniref:hypothetical protein n=1 Tax=Microbacterium sp. NPDC089189 TaxID=3154972 RepID=UPI0034435F66